MGDKQIEARREDLGWKERDFGVGALTCACRRRCSVSPCVFSAASKRCRSSSCSCERSYGAAEGGDLKFTTGNPKSTPRDPNPPPLYPSPPEKWDMGHSGPPRTSPGPPQPHLELSLKGVASALDLLQLPGEGLTLFPQPLLHLSPSQRSLIETMGPPRALRNLPTPPQDPPTCAAASSSSRSCLFCSCSSQISCSASALGVGPGWGGGERGGIGVPRLSGTPDPSPAPSYLRVLLNASFSARSCCKLG